MQTQAVPCSNSVKKSNLIKIKLSKASFMLRRAAENTFSFRWVAGWFGVRINWD